MLLLAVTAWSPAMAEGWQSKSQSTSEIQQVSYTTGETGRKLKWLPYRPTLEREDKPVTVAHHTPARPASLSREAQRGPGDPMNDPFGDRDARPDSAPKPNTVTDEVLQPPEPIPAPQGESRQELDWSLPPTSPNKAEGEMHATQEAMEESFVKGQVDLVDKCPSPEELKPIGEITTDILVAEKGEFPPECTLGGGSFEPRAWAPNCFTWKASGLCHKPLYFEDVQLERYGHSWGPFLQPVISGGHFFLTVPILPYKMGLNPPDECLYTLGYYRPGSCAPYMLDPLPLSIRASLFQAGAWVGGVAAIP